MAVDQAAKLRTYLEIDLFAIRGIPLSRVVGRVFNQDFESLHFTAVFQDAADVGAYFFKQGILEGLYKNCIMHGPHIISPDGSILVQVAHDGRLAGEEFHPFGRHIQPHESAEDQYNANCFFHVQEV